MDFSFRFKISTENFKLISSIWVRTKPHCRRIEGDRTILFSRTFFPVFFLVLFFTVLFSPVLFIPVRFTLTFFFVLFGSIFFPVFLFSCTFFPYFLLPYFFPPYYFFHVLFTRNFSKVATFEIQRFKISVSFFLVHIIISQFMFLAEQPFKRHPQGFLWTGGVRACAN